MAKRVGDLTGRRFERWTVISLAGRRSRHKLWKCKCDCGSIGVVQQGNLIQGISRSCGCFKLMRIRESKFRHGRDGSNPTYGTWASMRARCSNASHSKYPDYGKRGIKVCAAWSDFNQFLADMGERPSGKTLDRIDPNGDYEPSNCRWATPKEQRRNQRCTCPISAVLERLPELLSNLPGLAQRIGPQPIVRLLDYEMEDEIA